MNNSNDNEFDNKIIESMSQYLPQHGMISKINPWKRPIHQITLGMILTTITFNLFHLDDILPALGIAFMYVGCRALKNVNNSFKYLWKLSIMRLIIYFIMSTFVMATPLCIKLQDYIIITSIVNFFLQLLFIFLLRKALNLVFLEEKVSPTGDPLLWISILQTLLFLLCFISNGKSHFIFTLTLLGFILCYFFLFKQLYKTADYIKSVGYSLVNAPVKIRYEIFICGYVGFCLLLIIILSAFSYHISLPSQLLKPMDNFTVRTELINKGFPPEIMNDISDKDIELLSNAMKIETSVSNLNFESETPPKCTLVSTTVSVQVSNETIYFITHFKWKDGASYWSDGFRIDNTCDFKLINGALLYDKDDIKYTSDIPRLKYERNYYGDIFGTHARDLISGGVSYPLNSSNQRGYVFYEVKIPVPCFTGNNFFNYYHYSTPLRYPYAEAEKNYNLFDNHHRYHASNFSSKDADDYENLLE